MNLQNWYYPTPAPVELPVGMEHVDSTFCWCDPFVDLDSDGEEVVLHRQVTWN